MRLVIVVEGGVVQHVIADAPAGVVLRDFDNIDNGGKDVVVEVEIEPTIVEDVFAGIEDE